MSVAARMNCAARIALAALVGGIAGLAVPAHAAGPTTKPVVAEPVVSKPAGSKPAGSKPAGSTPATPKPSTRPTASKKAAPTSQSSEFDGSDEGLTLQAPLSTEAGSELMLFKDMPVIVAAGKRVQTQKEAAAEVSVVTADDIDIFGYRSIADLLGNQRSFYLDTDGLNWFAGVRGFLRPGEWNARLLLLVDDRPTRENIFGQTHIDLDFVVPIEAIKQVEVVRGPGSALYGGNAVFGVINVVTKDGADVNGTQLRLEGGTQETGRASVLYGSKLPGGWDLLASFSGYTSQGDRDIVYDGVTDEAHDYGHIRNFNYEGVDAAFVKLKNGEFTAEFDLETRNKDNDAATYDTSFFDPGAMHEDRSNITLKWDHEVAEGQSLHAMVYYSKYKYTQSWLYAADGDVPAYRYTTEASDSWVGEEVHYDWQMTPNFHLLLGADGTQSLATRQEDHDAINGRDVNVDATFNAFGLFAEGEEKISDQLTLVAGVREDYVQRVGYRFDPRAAVIYNPTKQDTIKALYGEAFRAPNLYEQLYSSPGYNVPNPSLKPEVISTYELAWEHQFKDGWRTTADGFIWKMHDAMEDVTLPDGAVQTQNGPTLWAHGVEGEISRRWKNDASVRAYATYTMAEHDGNFLPYSPKWTLGGAFAIPIINDHTFLSIEPQCVGAMRSESGGTTQPTFMTNVVFTSRHLWKRWEFQAGVYNLAIGHPRFPQDGAFNNYQNTLNWPDPQYLVSLSCKF